MEGANDDFDVLTEAEVAAVLGACSGNAPTGVRNRALVALLYASGLRLGEALDLADSDVDLAEGLLEVRAHRPRRVRLFGSALQFLEAWRLTRRNHGLASGGKLFCTLRGRRLKDAYVRALFKRLATKAGIGKRLHAFGLRRAFAIRAHQEGLGLEELQQQLGHATPQATFGYLADASAILAQGAANALRFELVAAPQAQVAVPRRVPPPKVESPPEPAPPPPPKVEEPPPALPASDEGAAYLGGEVRIVRPISLEEL